MSKAEALAAWPFPGDVKSVRRVRVAGAYRAALAVADPEACARLDELMTRFGETWVLTTEEQHDMDDLLTPRQAAEKHGVQVRQIARLRRSGKLPGVRDRHGAWRYRYRDVLALGSFKRRGRKVPAP